MWLFLKFALGHVGQPPHKQGDNDRYEGGGEPATSYRGIKSAHYWGEPERAPH